MSRTGQEIEVKFYLSDRARLARRLVELGARLEHEHIHEVNLRLDTPALELTNSGRLLRLRQDTAAHVTFKGPGSLDGGARLRQELEFIASDFSIAQALFEALGYQVYMLYEKFRTTYLWDGLLVTLDEMPFGNFTEIEGPDGASIQAAAARLGLNWERRILESYTMLFEQARIALGLTFRDLSFANFAGVQVPPQAMGAQPADA